MSHGAGCACKIGPADLAAVRGALPPSRDAGLLVGLDPADDAAVYRLRDDLALVQTLDFFTPIVDDAYDFGRIAAANALSDVYAMGAEPFLALNIVAFAIDSLGVDVCTEILRGGAAVAAEAGVAIGGGHSIDDPEPKYGMAVSGEVDPERILTKAGARPGDSLYLTKPVGGGLVTTAAKHGLTADGVIAAAVEVMTTLNRSAASQALAAGARAMTDVTGFGLLGHLHEVCLASGVAAEVDADAVPTIAGAAALAADPRCRAGGSRRNADHAEAFVSWDRAVGDEQRVFLTDAMTSGGLLVCVDDEGADRAPGVRIGELSRGAPGAIRVRRGAGARS